MGWSTTLSAMLVWSVVVPTFALATPPAGVVSNVIVAQGATRGPLKERAAVGDSWAVTIEDRGQSEFYFQDLVMGPGGYTGWHSHPGLLLITVKEGSVEFYDHACTKHTYVAGQSFTEGADAHTAMNRGTGNARLLVAYIVKKGEPRRIEAPQPPCGAGLGIP
jgi:quercetin dioxygenase-like cupin family protein